MKNLLVVLALVAIFAQNSFAGGAKKDATVKVQNTSSHIAAVIINPPANFPANPTQKQFTDAGGKIIQPGAIAYFSVKAGQEQIYGQLVNETNGAFIGNIAQITKTVAKGVTLNVTVSGTNQAVLQ